VAGTIEGFNAFLSLRCRTSDESCRQLCPASHTTALGGLFIADLREGMQQEVFGSEWLTDLVPEMGASRQEGFSHGTGS
jgi:hypothetical protein